MYIGIYPYLDLDLDLDLSIYVLFGTSKLNKAINLGFFFFLLFLFFQIPFDVTLQSITSLEDMFDVVNGCIITEENLLDWIISLLH